MKKFKKYTLGIVIMCVIMVFAGCNQKQGPSDEELCQRFLEEVFASDYENRFTEFEKDEDVEKFYAPFTEYVSKECIEGLKANRIPGRFDMAAKELGKVFKVSQMQLNFDDSGTADFEVLLADESDPDKAINKVTGQITVKDGAIDGFFVSNFVDVK